MPSPIFNQTTQSLHLRAATSTRMMPTECEATVATASTTPELPLVEDDGVWKKPSNAVKAPPPTTTTVPASSLVRQATPDATKHQKRVMKRVMVGLGLLYTVLVGVGSMILVMWWFRSRNAGLACSLGSALGYFYGPIVVWLVQRVTGIMVVLWKKPKTQLQEETPQEGPTRVTLPVVEEEQPNTVVWDHVATPTLGGAESPQLYFRLANESEIILQTNLLMRYGLVLFPVGIAPLCGLVTWQSGGDWTASVGCLMGYTVGTLYYPLVLFATARWTDQELFWMHQQVVRLASDEPPRKSNLEVPVQQQCSPREKV